MKKVFTLVLAIAILPFAIQAADLSWDTFKNSVAKAAPDGFEYSRRSNESRFLFNVQYDNAADQFEAIIFNFFPGRTEFNEGEKRDNPSVLKIDGRDALFTDGTKTGMSSLAILLKNKTGKLIIRHRKLGGKPTTLDGFKVMVEAINLDNLDKE